MYLNYWRYRPVNHIWCCHVSIRIIHTGCVMQSRIIFLLHVPWTSAYKHKNTVSNIYSFARVAMIKTTNRHPVTWFDQELVFPFSCVSPCSYLLLSKNHFMPLRYNIRILFRGFSDQARLRVNTNQSIRACSAWLWKEIHSKREPYDYIDI